MAAVGIVAGGPPLTALGLGASMALLQASIGALNDLVDAPADVGHKPGKPIPRGLATRREAAVLATVAAMAGGVLATLIGGSGLLALSGLVLTIGYTYDLRAKGTAGSWLPFALGVPLLPVFGWYGAAGTLPGWFAPLLPMAVLAGAALAIANAGADVERDAAAGRGSVAIRLGRVRAWWLGAALLTGALALAAAWLVGIGQADAVSIGSLAAGGLLALGGLAAGRSRSAERRERAWQLQAVAVAVVGIGWVWTVAGR